MPPGWGPKNRRGRRGYKAMPKCSADAQREVRSPVRARTRRESGATCAMAAWGARRGESHSSWCKGDSQEGEREWFGC
jgi:hypothetical protein